MLAGCRNRYTPPEQPMPPHTVLLSNMLRELSAQPGFMDALLAQVEGTKTPNTKRGPALLTPKLADELRKRILGKDWSGLDRFPGWTMRAINPLVDVAGHVVGRDSKLEAVSAVHPGAEPKPLDDRTARTFLDLGPYTLDATQTVSLDGPSTLPGFTTDGIVSDLGAGVTRGDGPNDLAAEHAESQRLADVLNRLAANGLQGAGAFTVELGGRKADVPQQLVALLTATGHEVRVQDARYFANFGHLHYRGQDVMMPFWIDSGIAVPGSGGLFTRPRPLLVPVSHAELEWRVRGPRINADVSFYFGIDGKAEWRTMDTLDQAWVLKRNAHSYSGPEALEVTRLTGRMVTAFMHQHARRPDLPFGGYYALGVCQDGVSAIEQKMTGAVTLFPNTADSELFDDPRDSEINAMFAAIPKDRMGRLPEPARVFGSLPTADFNAITIPGLADDLNATAAAWKADKLEEMHGSLSYMGRTIALAALAGACLAAVAGWLKRRA